MGREVDVVCMAVIDSADGEELTSIDVEDRCGKEVRLGSGLALSSDRGSLNWGVGCRCYRTRSL